MPLQAFKNDPQMKSFILSTLAVHREADEIVQGTYWENGKGCAVGCTLESVRVFRGQTSIEHSSHKLYEEYLGVPRILARLEDRIFENLSNGTAKAWPERFVGAIRPGADLAGVWPLFAAWMLADPQDGVIRFCRTDEQRAIVQKVAGTYRAGTASKADWAKIRDEAWRIRNTAYDATAATAATAYDATAAYAAYDAAYAAYDATAYAAATAYDATDAAYATAYAAATAYDATAYAYATAYDATAAAYARLKFYEKMADKLVELISAC